MMKKNSHISKGTFLILLMAFGVNSMGQSRSVNTMSPAIFIDDTGNLPEPVANCAVSGYTHNDTNYLYVFAGIDSTLNKSGIHRRCYKVNLGNMKITNLSNIPDSQGKIAGSATLIGDKIYIIGGYYVHPNGSEASSNKVHIYNPVADTFMADGAIIPIPIDDHIQMNYRDSLIYVFTGWSDGRNVREVQIYDPRTDKWFFGTPIPDSLGYKTFGGTGSMIYTDPINKNHFVLISGATDSTNFHGSRQLVEGHIDINDASKIHYDNVKTINEIWYRSLCLVNSYGGYLALGGASATYNYNARSYASNQVLQPRTYFSSIISENDFDADYWLVIEGDSITIPMDIRDWVSFPLERNSPYGIRQAFYTAGGIEFNQSVSSRIIRYEVDWYGGGEELSKSSHFRIYPNPANAQIQLESTRNSPFEIQIYNLLGNQLLDREIKSGDEIDISDFPKGMYLLYLPEGGENYKIFKQ